MGDSQTVCEFKNLTFQLLKAGNRQLVLLRDSSRLSCLSNTLNLPKIDQEIFEALLETGGRELVLLRERNGRSILHSAVDSEMLNTSTACCWRPQSGVVCNHGRRNRLTYSREECNSRDSERAVGCWRPRSGVAHHHGRRYRPTYNRAEGNSRDSERAAECASWLCWKIIEDTRPYAMCRQKGFAEMMAWRF